MAKVLGIVIALVLVVALGVFLIANMGGNGSNVTGNAVAGDSVQGNTVTFKVTSSHLRFFMNGVESPELKVKQGQTVRVEFVNEEGFHDFVIDELTGARTKQMAAPGSETIEFVADKKGSFEYYCSVGQHRANGMKGTFIVS